MSGQNGLERLTEEQLDELIKEILVAQALIRRGERRLTAAKDKMAFQILTNDIDIPEEIDDENL